MKKHVKSPLPESWVKNGGHLYLMRAGRSVSCGDILNDYNKPLSAAGVKHVLAQLERFRLSETVRPDCILCSSAVRARQTAELLSSLFAGVPVFPKDALYLAPSFRLIETLSELDTIFRRVMIIGHHPGLSQLLAYLTEENVMMLPFKPADCVVIRLPAKLDWHHLEPGMGKVDYFFAS